MKRVLLTGMSGTGKSTVIGELAARGYKAVDTDSDEWCEWITSDGASDWVWRDDRMRELLTTDDAPILFVCGCKSNQGAYYEYFEHIILLSAPEALMIERITTRTNNPYGKHPDELAEVLDYVRTVEPLLRRGATLEIDTSVPVAQVVATILAAVRS